MQTLLKRAARFAARDASVVILGETGTGKEVVARILHANSVRAKQPFIAVNVAALPTELLESELFGHGKGAFTGAATARRGPVSYTHLDVYKRQAPTDEPSPGPPKGRTTLVRRMLAR